MMTVHNLTALHVYYGFLLGKGRKPSEIRKDLKRMRDALDVDIDMSDLIKQMNEIIAKMEKAAA